MKASRLLLLTTQLACAPAPLGTPLPVDPERWRAEPPPPPIQPTTTIATPPACASDADCGYDPAADRCLADPRANRQPALVDQGLVCYCDRARCAALRVAPVPCESDASCAVSADPRPHPIAADAAHPHQRGRPCHDFLFSTTCERTNICTMHSLPCPRP